MQKCSLHKCVSTHVRLCPLMSSLHIPCAMGEGGAAHWQMQAAMAWQCTVDKHVPSCALPPKFPKLARKVCMQSMQECMQAVKDRVNATLSFPGGQDSLALESRLQDTVGTPSWHVSCIAPGMFYATPPVRALTSCHPKWPCTSSGNLGSYRG